MASAANLRAPLQRANISSPPNSDCTGSASGSELTASSRAANVPVQTRCRMALPNGQINFRNGRQPTISTLPRYNGGTSADPQGSSWIFAIYNFRDIADKGWTD